MILLRYYTDEDIVIGSCLIDLSEYNPWEPSHQYHVS